jgi:hypothetical protein
MKKNIENKDVTAIEFYLGLLGAKLERSFQEILVRENTWSSDEQSNEHQL